MKRCVIIAGASGEIGKEFTKRFLDVSCVIGISRHNLSQISHPNLESLLLDLTKPEEIEKTFADFDALQYDEIVLIHLIGRDKFENTHFPKIEPLNTIDANVYDSNVNTYKYIARCLIGKIKVARDIKPVKLKLVMLASVADRYGLLVMTSFSESKNIVRSYMRDAVRNFPWISALVINISSTITKGAFEVRPYSDITYWLTPKDVVDRSWKRVLEKQRGYKEINLYKKDPAFKKTYYFDDKAVFERWKKYVKGK